MADNAMTGAERVALVRRCAAALQEAWGRKDEDAEALSRLAQLLEAEQAGARHCAGCDGRYSIDPMDADAVPPLVRPCDGLPVPEAGGEPVGWLCPECDRYERIPFGSHDGLSPEAEACSGRARQVGWHPAAPSPSPGLESLLRAADDCIVAATHFSEGAKGHADEDCGYCKTQRRLRAALAAHREGRG